MKEIAIYGAGGLGREVASMLLHISSSTERWQFIGFFDDKDTIEESCLRYGPHLGGIDALNNWKSELDVLLCFGNPHTLKHIYSKISNQRVAFPNLIIPGVWFSDKDSIKLGKGNIILGRCEFTTDIHIGDFNLFNGDVVVAHDAVIGNFNVFMPACRVSGQVTIGNECLFGAMSMIHQQLSIPDNVTLAPLSALLTKPKAGKTYIGNPAKLFRY